MEITNVAVIGAGYWGKNLIRVFYSLGDEAKLKYICDSDEKKLANIKKMYPNIFLTTDCNQVFDDPEVAAVLIATPTASHYGLVKKSLTAGKNTLVEKPMTENAAQAAELVSLAKEKGLVLAVDHTFLYTAAVRKIKELIGNNELGGIHYIDSERINLGLIQPDVNVIYDLAAHDIAIINFILEKKPLSVSAIGKSFVTKGSAREVEEVAHMHLEYPGGIAAHINSSWLSPVKLRRFLIAGNKKMIIYDDIEPSDKIKILDQGIDVDLREETPFRPIYRSGDIIIPKLSNAEALVTEANDFIGAIRKRGDIASSGEYGLEVVRVLEKATESMRNNGLKIYL